MVYLDFTGALSYLDSYGLTDLFLPFIFVFALMFAILQKVEIFKDGSGEGAKPNRKINSILSLVISLLVVIPHMTGGYPAGYDAVIIINSILPGSMLILVAIVMFLMLAGLVGGGMTAQNSTITAIIAFASVIGIGYVIWNAIWPNTLPSWLYWVQDSGLQSLILVLLVCGLVIYMVTKDDSAPKTEWQKELKGLFK